MMEVKMLKSQAIPQAQNGQTKASQVWNQLSVPQQREILQRIIQACQMLVKEKVKTREVGHEPPI